MRNKNKIMLILKMFYRRSTDDWRADSVFESWADSRLAENKTRSWCGAENQPVWTKSYAGYWYIILLFYTLIPTIQVFNCVIMIEWIIGCSWTSPEANQCPEQSRQSRTRPNTAFKGWLGEWSQRPSCKLSNVQRTRYWKPHSRCWSRERSQT